MNVTIQIPSNGCLGLKHENVKMIYSNWLTGLGWPRAITIWVGEPRLGVYALDSCIVWPISNHLCLVSLSMDLSNYKSRRKRSCLPYRLDNCLVNKYICGWIGLPNISEKCLFFSRYAPLLKVSRKGNGPRKCYWWLFLFVGWVFGPVDLAAWLCC